MQIYVLISTTISIFAMGLNGIGSKSEQSSAVIGARSRTLFIQGGQLEKSAKESIAVAKGPLPGVQAIAAGKKSDTVLMKVKLDEPVGEQATISFWMRPDKRYQNGEGQESIKRQLFEIPGIGQCVFRQTPVACNLSWKWDESRVKGVDDMSTNLPELPGPEWYHVLYTRDSKRGRFDAFVNGTPQRLPGTEIDPWSKVVWVNCFTSPLSTVRKVLTAGCWRGLEPWSSKTVGCRCLLSDQMDQMVTSFTGVPKSFQTVSLLSGKYSLCPKMDCASSSLLLKAKMAKTSSTRDYLNATVSSVSIQKARLSATISLTMPTRLSILAASHRTCGRTTTSI